MQTEKLERVTSITHANVDKIQGVVVNVSLELLLPTYLGEDIPTTMLCAEMIQSILLTNASELLRTAIWLPTYALSAEGSVVFPDHQTVDNG